MVINIPSNFSSIYEDLVYEFKYDEESDVVIEINDTRTDEVIGVKKFYSTSTVKLNIAPLIFDSMLPEPQAVTLSGVVDPALGFPRISLTSGSTTTIDRYFTYAKSELAGPALMTTMPQERILNVGERDAIYTIVPVGVKATYKVSATAADGNQVDLEQEVCSSSDLANIFYLCADQFSSDYNVLRVSFYSGTELQQEINYTLSREPSNGYRVAWISQSGSIEHYTFPTILDQTYLSSGATTKTLRSAYGTAAEIEALSQIISSPKVWRDDYTHYTQIEVVTTEHVVRENGALSVATIKIKENG